MTRVNYLYSDIKCLQEMWIGASTENIKILEYVLVLRKDRDTIIGGDVAIYRHHEFDKIIGLDMLMAAERIYAIIHSDMEGQDCYTLGIGVHWNYSII